MSKARKPTRPTPPTISEEFNETCILAELAHKPSGRDNSQPRPRGLFVVGRTIRSPKLLDKYVRQRMTRDLHPIHCELSDRLYREQPHSGGTERAKGITQLTTMVAKREGIATAPGSPFFDSLTGEVGSLVAGVRFSSLRKLVTVADLLGCDVEVYAGPMHNHKGNWRLSMILPNSVDDCLSYRAVFLMRILSCLSPKRQGISVIFGAIAAFTFWLKEIMCLVPLNKFFIQSRLPHEIPADGNFSVAKLYESAAENGFRLSIAVIAKKTPKK